MSEVKPREYVYYEVKNDEIVLSDERLPSLVLVDRDTGQEFRLIGEL